MAGVLHAQLTAFVGMALLGRVAVRTVSVPPFVHGVAGIEAEVHHDLLELRFVAVDQSTSPSGVLDMNLAAAASL